MSFSEWKLGENSVQTKEVTGAGVIVMVYSVLC